MASLGDVKDVIVIILSGMAMFLGIMLGTYAIAIALDKWCFCFMHPMATTEEEMDERRRASPLVKRAGLAGMLRGERTKTLRQFFGKLAYAYQKEIVEGEDETSKEKKKAAKQKKSIENVETAPKSEEGDIENGLDSKKDETEPRKSSEIKEEANDNGEEEDKELQELAEMEHTDGTCPICLNEYENGDKVMTGTSCSHLFHYDCMMKWLEKGHDHCAYCRKDMLSSKEYVEMAREVVGDARVDRLIMINEELERVNGTNDTIPYNIELANILLGQPSQETEPEIETPNTAAASTAASEEPSSTPKNAPSVAFESEEAGPAAVPSGNHLEEQVLQESTADLDIEAPEDKEGDSPVDAAEVSSQTAEEIKVVEDEKEYKTKEPSKEDVSTEKEDQVDIESGSNNDESSDAERG